MNAAPGAALAPDAQDVLMLSQVYAQRFLTATILAFKSILDGMALDDDLLSCFEEKGSR